VYKIDIDLWQFVKYEMIVKATIVDISEAERTEGIHQLYDKKVAIEIGKVFKGKLESERLTIYSSLDGAACGLPLEVGQKWLLYLYRFDGKLSTGLCTRSQRVKSKKFDWCADKKFIEHYSCFTGLVEDESAKGELVNGLPVGEWEFYSMRGNLLSKGIYNTDGKKHGEFISYNTEGKVMARYIYEDGVLIKTTSYREDRPIENDR